MFSMAKSPSDSLPFLYRPPPTGYLTRETHFTHKQSSINKKQILSKTVTIMKMTIIQNDNNMKKRMIKLKMVVMMKKTVVMIMYEKQE